MDSTIVFNTVASASSSSAKQTICKFSPTYHSYQNCFLAKSKCRIFAAEPSSQARVRWGCLSDTWPENNRSTWDLTNRGKNMIWLFKNLEVVPKHARFHWRFRDRWTLFQNSFGFISEFLLAFQEFKGLCFADSWNLLQDAGRSVDFQLVCVPFVYKSGSDFFLLLLIFWIMYQDVSSTFIE